MDHLLAKISAAVESGDITQEQADAKLADIHAKRNARTEKMSAKLESIKAEIAAAVQNGKLTQDEADEKITLFQEKMENGPKHGKGINFQTQSAIDNVSERLEKVISY